MSPCSKASRVCTLYYFVSLAKNLGANADKLTWLATRVKLGASGSSSIGKVQCLVSHFETFWHPPERCGVFQPKPGVSANAPQPTELLPRVPLRGFIFDPASPLSLYIVP